MKMKKNTFKLNPIRAAVIGTALMAANSAAMAAPVNTSLEFVCPFPLIGDQNIIAQISADIPEEIDVSSGAKTVGPFYIDTISIIPDKARQGLAFVDATTITGTAIALNTIHTVIGDIPLNANLIIESTTVPTDESGPFEVPANGDAPAITVEPAHEGTVSITVDDLILNLKNLKADGSTAPAPIGEFTADCTLSPGQDNVLTTLEVVGDSGPALDPADIVVDSTSIDFGSMQLGQNLTRTITITNAGDLDLGINSISISGTGAASFTENNACTTISAGSTCSIELTYTASEEGTQKATLVINSTDGDTPSVSVSLSGTAQLELSPEIEVNVSSIDFGTIEAGTSKSEAITIMNTGGAALTISGINVTGSEFLKTADNCSIIAAGSSCSTEVTYQANPGASTGSVIITSDDEDEASTTVSLAGIGETVTPPTLEVDVNLEVNGSTYITANGGTMPLTGTIESTIDLFSGYLTGDLKLNPTVGKFEIIQGWSRYMATAQVEFETVGITEGTLIDGQLTATASAYIKLPKVTKTMFGLINWPIGGGLNCRTIEPVTFAISSPAGESFDPLLGGRVTGTYDLPKLENCGALTSILTFKMKGNDNTIDLVLKPIL